MDALLFSAPPFCQLPLAPLQPQPTCFPAQPSSQPRGRPAPEGNWARDHSIQGDAAYRKILSLFSGNNSLFRPVCEFRFNPARDSDLMSAAAPI